MTMTSNDSLARLARVIESRKVRNGGDPSQSYVARLLHQGPDAFLKKSVKKPPKPSWPLKTSTTAAPRLSCKAS